MNKYKAIINLIRREDVTLFVGSGCSIASGAPTARGLIEQVWQLLEAEYQDDESKSSLMEVSESLVVQEGGNRTKLNQVLDDAFSNLKPSTFHKLLVRIPHIHTIITTNYDSLIENAYSSDLSQVIVCDSDLVNTDARKVQVLKIHGDLKHKEHIVITKTDYRRFLNEPSNVLLWSRITNEFSTKHIVFVGYSADDQNILNLIEQVKERTSDTIKRMYLIAPHLKAVQERRLKSLGVYIMNGTGEEFLQDVFSSLKWSFGEDKYNNICSQDTLNRFALLSGIQFSFENNGKHTSIKQWHSVNGAPCPLTMDFSSKTLNVIDGTVFTTTKEIVKGFGVPMYALTDDELASFRMSINGLRINATNELKRVLIAPAIKDIDIAFVSRANNIDCRCKAKRYTLNGSCHILIPTPLFNMELEIDFSDITKKTFTGALSTKQNDGPFDDLEKAIKWSRLMTGLQERADVTLFLGPIQLENVNFSKTQEALPPYRDYLGYCTNLYDIEKSSNTILPRYDGFTQMNYLFSKIIRAYLRHEPFVDRVRESYKSFTMDVKRGDFHGNGDYTVRVVTRINDPVSLCGVDFTIVEERVLLRYCKIESDLSITGDIERLHIANQLDTAQYEYCDEGEPDNLFEE